MSGCPSFQLLTIRHSDLIVPAVQGTTTILNSALKYGSTLKRVILTSSAVAALEVTEVPRFFTESTWNEAAVEAVKTKASVPAPIIYFASKTLAEKAAWDFVAAHNSEISWDLAVMNPSLIIGVRLSHLFSLQLTGADIHTRDSLRLCPRRQSTISIPLSAKSMTRLPVRWQVHNYGDNRTGSMWLSLQRRMCAPHMQQPLVANASSSTQVPYITKTFVSLTIRFCPSYVILINVLHKIS